MRAIERAERVFARLGYADAAAMREAERRGDLCDFPLRRLVSAWLMYAWATRNPDFAGDAAPYRASLRAAVRGYRAVHRPRVASLSAAA